MSAILALVQFPLMSFCKFAKVPSIFKLIAKGSFSTIGGFATVYSFRGIWYLLDAYYITGKNLNKQQRVKISK